MSFYEREKITLDYYNNNIVTINAKQHDKRARLIEITCTNHGKKVQLKPSEVSAFIRLKKPDNTYVFSKCNVPDDDRGVAMFELSGTMLAVPGECLVDVMIINATNVEVKDINSVKKMQQINSSIISTMSFTINVYPNPIADANIESTNEYSALISTLQKYENVQVSINNIEKNVINTVINDSKSSNSSTYSSDKLDEIIPNFKRRLTSVDDLNNIVECGNYYYSTSDLPKNAPFENAAIVEVVETGSGDTRIIQRATRYGKAGETRHRAKYDGSWLDWSRYVTDIDLNGLMFKSTLKTNVTQNYVQDNILSFNGGLYHETYPNGVFLILLNSNQGDSATATAYIVILGASGSKTASTIRLDSNTGTLPILHVTTSGYIAVKWSATHTGDIRANIFKLA